jgi:predicted nuclease with TOPRIM domain
MGIPGLAEIERLITEHGSAAILKERLALASDQYSALEKKLTESKLRNKQLQSENARLHLDLEKAQDEIRNLKEKLVERHGQSLEEVAEKILVVLSQHEELTAEQVGRLVGVGAQLATYHLSELQQQKMVMDYLAVDSPVYWGIIQGGRAYLVKRGLLN